MSLKSSKDGLESAILKAFEKALETGRNAGEQDKSAQIRKDLAKDLCNAIHSYVISADVNISTVNSQVPPGVAVAAPPPAGTGTTIAPGIVQHAGLGKLE